MITFNESDPNLLKLSNSPFIDWKKRLLLLLIYIKKKKYIKGQAKQKLLTLNWLVLSMYIILVYVDLYSKINM